jgi:hypothetical protein
MDIDIWCVWKKKSISDWKRDAKGGNGDGMTDLQRGDVTRYSRG